MTWRALLQWRSLQTLQPNEFEIDNTITARVVRLLFHVSFVEVSFQFWVAPSQRPLHFWGAFRVVITPMRMSWISLWKCREVRCAEDNIETGRVIWHVSLHITASRPKISFLILMFRPGNRFFTLHFLYFEALQVLGILWHCYRVEHEFVCILLVPCVCGGLAHNTLSNGGLAHDTSSVSIA